MAPRRRFFPATAVQTVPGRTVELEMQLRPVVKAAAPAPAPPPVSGDDEIFGVGWLAPTLDEGPEPNLWSELLPDGRYLIKNSDAWAFEASIWEGVPVFVDADFVVHPVPGPEFHCVELQVDTTYGLPWPGRTFFGVIQGTTMTNVSWEYEWDFVSSGPDVSRLGHQVVTYGNVLHLICQATGSTEKTDTLTARAFSSGVQVGQLIFRGVAHAF